jgi:hypothetical protein
MLGTEKLRTTAYNPRANGMVERFHRQLKAALMTRHDRTNWVEHLPVILLGIRNAVKEDLGHTATEMLYGEPVRLPGDFFQQSGKQEDTGEYISRIKSKIRELNYQEPRMPNVEQQKLYKDKWLDKVTHVYVRVDRVKRSLEAPYEGPYEIIERKPKYYMICRKGKPDAVSIDRLKAAHVDQTGEASNLATKPVGIPLSYNESPPTRPMRIQILVQPENRSAEDGTQGDEQTPQNYVEESHERQVVNPQELIPKETRCGRKIQPPKRYITIATANPMTHPPTRRKLQEEAVEGVKDFLYQNKSLSVYRRQ